MKRAFLSFIVPPDPFPPHGLDTGVICIVPQRHWFSLVARSSTSPPQITQRECLCCQGVRHLSVVLFPWRRMFLFILCSELPPSGLCPQGPEPCAPPAQDPSPGVRAVLWPHTTQLCQPPPRTLCPGKYCPLLCKCVTDNNSAKSPNPRAFLGLFPG